MPSYQSDHSIVILTLKFNDFKHGKGLWKHNNMFLSDINYINTINDKIIEIKKQYMLPVYNTDNIETIPDQEIQFVINDQLFLNTVLMEIRGKAISYCSYKTKSRNNRENQIKVELEQHEKSFTESNVLIIDELKKELTKIQEGKLKGAIIRSRAEWIQFGEKPSKLFCNLEKYNYTTKTITSLTTDDGLILDKQVDILNETALFYKTLYQNNDSTNIDDDLNSFIENINIPKLSNEESKQLEGPITLSEASYVLKNMANNKSPGSSGFSIDFYKVFWPKLGTFVCRALNHAFDSGKLSITQCQGIITCIPKGDKPRQFLKNWRPITLLNTVYKIGSGSIANRLKQHINKLINNDQTGFIKGRFIGENTRLIYDILKYTEENNIPGLLLLIDFEKAFDSLSWRFVNKTLSLFNFGPDISKWFNILYKDGISAVTQCGSFSDFFQIQR